MLHLNARIDFHEVVARPIDDALERRRGVQLDRFPEAFGLFFHPAEDLEILLYGGGGGFVPRGSLALNSRGERLLRNRNLEELLLMHLERAIASP